MATAKELRELSVEDLHRRADELKKTLVDQTMQLKTGGLNSPAARVANRRDLARIQTVLTQKQSKP